MNRKEIKDCPNDATHVHMNLTGEFIQMFYKIEGKNVQYRSFANIWFFSESAAKDPTFINKLIKIKDK